MLASDPEQAVTMKVFKGATANTVVNVADAAREAGAVTRVLHYGDSLIDMDRITGPLRRRLHKRYGDGGHGRLAPAPVSNQ